MHFFIMVFLRTAKALFTELQHAAHNVWTKFVFFAGCTLRTWKLLFERSCNRLSNAMCAMCNLLLLLMFLSRGSSELRNLPLLKDSISTLAAAFDVWWTMLTWRLWKSERFWESWYLASGSKGRGATFSILFRMFHPFCTLFAGF